MDESGLWQILAALGQLPAQAYKAMVPLPARAFAKSLVGDKTPMTESYLSNSDLDALRQATQESFYRSQKYQRELDDAERLSQENFHVPASEHWPDLAKSYKEMASPTLQYEDYPNGLELGSILEALGIPASGVMHTIGRAQVEKQPSGDVAIKDTYGFNPITTGGEDPSYMKGFMGAGPYGLLRVLGSRAVGDSGYPVNINLGKPEDWKQTEMPIDWTNNSEPQKDNQNVQN